MSAKTPSINIDPAIVDDYDLHPLAGWLYVVIKRHLNRAGNDAFPSVARLAKLANMSKASVIRYTKELEAKNLIVVSREKTSIVQSVNHYQLPGSPMVSDSNHNGVSQQPVVSHSNHKTPQKDTAMVSDSNTNHKDINKHSSVNKKQERAREDSGMDDVPKQDRLEICKAWADNLGAHPIGAYSDSNQRIAAEIWRAGYRATQVALFVRAKKADGWWKGKTLTLAKVAELMPEWLIEHGPNAKRFIPAEVVNPQEKPQFRGFEVNEFVRAEVLAARNG